MYPKQSCNIVYNFTQIFFFFTPRPCYLHLDTVWIVTFTDWPHSFQI